MNVFKERESMRQIAEYSKQFNHHMAEAVKSMNKILELYNQFATKKQTENGK